MVGKPSASAFQNFLEIENQLNIKKVIGRNVWMCFVSNASTYRALNALEILMPYVNSVNIYVSLCLRVQNRRRKAKSATQFQHVPYSVMVFFSYFNMVFDMVFNTPNINIFNTP